MDAQKRYTFIKEYKTQEGTIPQGSEITLLRGVIYLNGGMIHPAYQAMLKNIIDDDTLRDEYLKEDNIIFNKV